MFKNVTFLSGKSMWMSVLFNMFLKVGHCLKLEKEEWRGNRRRMKEKNIIFKWYDHLPRKFEEWHDRLLVRFQHIGKVSEQQPKKIHTSLHATNFLKKTSK